MFSSYQFEINSQIGQDQNQITDPNPNHNFPSFDRNGFNELLHAIQAIPTIPTIPEEPPELQVKTKDTGNGRKRSIRRDRHSKIVTAKGPRDRRMRLSLDVAKKFFDLQDVLGFDKASKTVDWLLTKSKDAIKSLSGSGGGGSRSEHKGSSSCGNWKIESSSTSECEVDSANPVEEERIGQFAGAGEITRAQINKSSAEWSN